MRLAVGAVGEAAAVLAQVASLLAAAVEAAAVLRLDRLLRARVDGDVVLGAVSVALRLTGRASLDPFAPALSPFLHLAVRHTQPSCCLDDGAADCASKTRCARVPSLLSRGRAQRGGGPTSAAGGSTSRVQVESALLPGSFLAFLATSSASAVSRFELTGPPWVRTDGVSLVAKASDLASGNVLAPLSLGANGQVPMGVYDVWTGSDSPSQVATENCRG